MRIAHINNTANVAWRLAAAQRRMGHEVVVCSLYETPFEFPCDVRIAGAEGPIGFNKAMFSRRKYLSGFDVLHIHGGIWKAQVFYPWLKFRFPEIVIAVHYHGSETRTGKGLHHRYCIDVSFHSTPDLADRLRNSVWVPNPVDLPDQYPEPNNALPRFVHFVSSGVHKGTDAVIKIFRRTFGDVRTAVEGPITTMVAEEAELWVVSKVPHREALRIMGACDGVIDQVSSFGSYGVVAVEAMALGKPVFCTINRSMFPGCPIIPIQDGVDAELRAVSDDPSYRRRIGRAGREYVAKVHDSHKVANAVVAAYAPRALFRRSGTVGA